MGLAAAFAITIIMCGLALMARRYFIYAYSSLFIFFSELGEGFTSFNASFVFNQDFISFASLKSIEIITAGSYACLLFVDKNGSSKVLKREKLYGIAFLCTLFILLLVEYSLHSNINISDWRIIIVGFLIFHIFSICLRSKDETNEFVKFFILALGLKAFLGLAAYSVGHGVISPRGHVPFFWDSKQVDAFSFCAILLTAYLAAYKDIRPDLKIIKKNLSAIILVILIITILLSIRRTIWVITFLGIVSTMLVAKRITVKHYILASFGVFLLLIIIIAAPPFENIRNKLGGYIASMNLLDDTVSKSIDNEVHIDNVEKYKLIITENPSIFFLGYRGYAGDDYMNLPEKYSDKYPLGVAHNGILRSLFYFGIGGLVIFVMLIVDVCWKYFRIRKQRENELMKHIAISSTIWLALTFSASLFYIPPFWTTYKGIYYTFIAIFFVRASIYYYKEVQDLDNDIISVKNDPITGNKFDECKLR